MLRFTRLAGTRLRIEITPPIHLPADFDDAAAMALLHARLEAWITERPDQWFWVHRRWGKDV
jgi:KDO2-lipid IV(A) lauroyltransferase